ncbi:MAG: DUF1573 domain-containing protein [Thermoguttaceae bacterium]|nr:DUF1573 domain-containing protein [Thermoguttaceae bacterium]
MRTFGIVILSALIVGTIIGYATWQIYHHFNYWDVSFETEENIAKVVSPNKNKNIRPINSLAGQAQVKVSETNYDFGILEMTPENEKGSHDFYVENVGTQPLTLKESGKGCLCTTCTIAKATVVPGDKTKITIAWDASRSGGIFSQGVKVSTSDPTFPEIFFRIHGLYTAAIIANPNHLKMTGMKNGTQAEEQFRIYGFEKDENGLPFPLEIVEQTISNPDFFDVKIEKVGLDQLTEEDKSSKLFSETTNLFIGTVTMKPGMRQGAFEETLRLRTNSPKFPILEIPIEGQIAGSINITGNRYDRNRGILDLGGNISSQKGAEESLRLMINDTIVINEETLKVERTRPDWLKDDIHITYPTGEMANLPVKMIDIKIQLPPGTPLCNFNSTNAEQSGEIVFSVGTDDNKQEVIIPVKFAVGP